MTSTIWSFAAPGDRETLASAGLAWLLDPHGSHGLGTSMVNFLFERSALQPTSGDAIEIVTEDSPSRDRRFDIAVKEGNATCLVIEVKCKTFGSDEQLHRYAKSAQAVMRVGFGEWNWPTLEPADRRRFPLTSFSQIADHVLSHSATGLGQGPTAVEFAEHMLRETNFLNQLYGFFVDGECLQFPPPPTHYRYSQRFLNQLYWRWFQVRAKQEHPTLDWGFKSASNSSGVWLSAFWREVSEDQRVQLPLFDLTLEGPLAYWVHVEFYNGSGLLAKPGDFVGMIQLRIGGDADNGRRARVLAVLESKKSKLESAGWRLLVLQRGFEM